MKKEGAIRYFLQWDGECLGNYEYLAYIASGVGRPDLMLPNDTPYEYCANSKESLYCEAALAKS